MPSNVSPPNQPNEAIRKHRREKFSTLAKAYNDGLEQGGVVTNTEPASCTLTSMI